VSKTIARIDGLPEGEAWQIERDDSGTVRARLEDDWGSNRTIELEVNHVRIRYEDPCDVGQQNTIRDVTIPSAVLRVLLDLRR
jgi:hypothetical protein